MRIRALRTAAGQHTAVVLAQEGPRKSGHGKAKPTHRKMLSTFGSDLLSELGVTCRRIQSFGERRTAASRIRGRPSESDSNACFLRNSSGVIFG